MLAEKASNEKFWNLVWYRIVSEELNRVLQYHAKPEDQFIKRFKLANMEDN